jgi:hypothetical protein
MKRRNLKPKLKNWQGPDHKFAIGALAMMIFLFAAGLTNWWLSGNHGVAAAGGSSTTVTIAR